MLDANLPNQSVQALVDDAAGSGQPLLFSVAELQAALAVAVPDDAAAERYRGKPAPRINKPERCQGEWRAESLDERLDPDHPVRLVWAYIEGLDFSAVFERIKAVAGVAGRNASDDRVLFALLLWAAIDGVDSAREIARLSVDHRAYAWLRGGVPLNYHMLADCRTEYGELLDRFLSESLASLLHEGLISLETTAQDGTKVRASAGGSSFRREATLAKHLEIAERRVQEVRAQADDASIGLRQQKARERAAREKLERVQAALENQAALAQSREARQKGDGVKARASTTDPEARTMQMADGGFRPAYNVQFETDTASGIIVGVEVINQGNDQNQLAPLTEQVQERVGQTPENKLADGGYVSIDDIEKTAALGTTVLAPPKQTAAQKAAGKDPYQPKKGDTPAVAAWRMRMGTEAAQALYRLRGQTAEWVNAGMRNRGLQRFLVRGLAKVRAVVLWHVLAHNLLRVVALRAKKGISGEIPCA